MIEQIVANDVIELLIGVLCRYALEKPVPEIILVCRRIRSSGASKHLATIPNGRSVIPVEGLAHAEIGSEIVIHSELNITRIQ